MGDYLGYIKLHRAITENELWLSDKFSKGQAWTDLLLLASYKKRSLFIRGIEIILQPGQLCYSQLSLSKRWGWNFKTVKKFLKLLENRKMVETKTGNITTVISILNWNLYQTDGDQNGDQKETKTETNNKVKKEKNNICHPLQRLILEEYPQTSKMDLQLSTTECKKLVGSFSSIQIKELLDTMENWKPLLKRNRSVYQTFLNWSKRQFTNNGNGDYKKKEIINI